MSLSGSPERPSRSPFRDLIIEKELSNDSSFVSLILIVSMESIRLEIMLLV